MSDNVIAFPERPQPPKPPQALTEADQAQRLAADPRINAFVTANAGTGKTKTLIDRVARLLLAEARPEAILCVTYTKAAAAEMQRRLFARLGDWSVMDDARLRADLAELDGSDPDGFDAGHLSKARALFTQALETPGGLKIQTIHAFCEKLLRRFPLEAGVSPSFEVMDDTASAAVAEAARQKVALMTRKSTGVLAEAYARMSVALDFGGFQSMFATFEAQRGALDRYIERCGGIAGAVAHVRETCGLPPGQDGPAELAAQAMAAFDRGLWKRCASALMGGTATDQKNAARMAALAADPDAALEQLLACLFTKGGEDTPAAWVAKTSGLKAHEALRSALLDEQDRLAIVRERVRAARVWEDTARVLILADAYIKAYGLEKAWRGVLDFADLIAKAQRLLTEQDAAAWVLFKLDGGIDHILLDEAQDTAPEQWTILNALTGEFFSGAGAPRWDAKPGDLERTLFVVGDEKQSIYSFQGADPALLEIETDRYLLLIRGAGRKAEPAPLTASFRSTHEVLSFVDAVFSRPEMERAVPPARGQDRVRHDPMRQGHRGCVDLWPLEQEPTEEKREAWEDPVDIDSLEGANRKLANRIALEIEALVARGDRVFDKDLRDWRPARFGDVLILVRRRGALFEEILRALKRASLPVAGADRLALSQHIAFDDLLALARFCLFPDDDLTLAALLKSPFCSLTDEDLYALAHPRRQSLWALLQGRADENGLWQAATDFLAGMIEASRRCRPFEFFGRALGHIGADGRAGRARFMLRLGSEANDVIDEFLAQVLAAELRGVHDLEGLTAALSALDITVKREMEETRGEVRVMTAHGAKGLEAPIVFLPEMFVASAPRGGPLLRTDDGGFLWCSRAADDCEATKAAREKRTLKAQEESLRLFYVALTRARDRLILCGRISATTKIETVRDWYGAAKDAFEDAGLAPHVRQVVEGDLTFTRFGEDPLRMPRERGEGLTAADLTRGRLPAWISRPAPAEPASARFASPSSVAETERGPAPSPLAAVGGLGRFRRGELIHRLLQLLPDVPAAERPPAATRLLSHEPGLTDDQRAEMAVAALSVLTDPRFSEVFGPGSRAEVALAGIAGRLPTGMAASGRMDRIVVMEDRVLVIDFKTNRPAPARVEDADFAYIAQLAIYRAVLSQVFPGRRIEAALVWTDGPNLMPVPENLMDQALARIASPH
jgi:ATP-dependent helicase/nuclease subunit A